MKGSTFHCIHYHQMKIIQDQKHLIVSGFPDFLSVASIK